MAVDTIQQTVENIETTICNPKLVKVKKDTLKILQEYPLTYKEFEEYINYLNKIKDNSTLMILELSNNPTYTQGIAIYDTVWN